MFKNVYLVIRSIIKLVLQYSTQLQSIYIYMYTVLGFYRHKLKINKNNEK